MSKQSKGFTLIELLVVIAIIGLLASIVLASLNSARAKGRDARRISDVKSFQTALELYYSNHNGYPTTDQGLSQLVTDGDIASVSTDPGSSSYTYAASSDSQHYCIESRLEGALPSGAATACVSGVTGSAPTGSGGNVYIVSN